MAKKSGNDKVARAANWLSVNWLVSVVVVCLVALVVWLVAGASSGDPVAVVTPPAPEPASESAGHSRVPFDITEVLIVENGARFQLQAPPARLKEVIVTRKASQQMATEQSITSKGSFHERSNMVVDVLHGAVAGAIAWRNAAPRRDVTFTLVRVDGARATALLPR